MSTIHIDNGKVVEHIDCKGLACPGPVIRVKKTLEGKSAGESFSIELDSEASVENVIRFAQNSGAGVQVQKEANGVVRMIITTSGKETGKGTGKQENSPPVVVITGETIGNGDDRLGHILMEGFISALVDQERIPDKILFMNAGVKLAIQGSPVLETLAALVDKGCEVLVCGTCLDFFAVKEKLSIGVVSNMFEIQRAMLEASSVVRP